MRRVGPAPEDPEALCSLLIVNSTFHAKILYHYLKVRIKSNHSTNLEKLPILFCSSKYFLKNLLPWPYRNRPPPLY